MVRKIDVGNLEVPKEQTRTPSTELAESIQRQECIASGGRWDSVRKICIPQETVSREIRTKEGLPSGVEETKRDVRIDIKKALEKKQISEPKQEFNPTKPETITDEKGNITGLILPDGRELLGLSEEDVNAILKNFDNIPAQVAQKGILPVGSQRRQEELRQQSAQLAGQVGQFGQLGISPTGFDFGEAATTGLVSAIPRALSLGATGALAGAALGGKAGAGAAPITGGVSLGGGVAIGAIGGFVSGIIGAMSSNLKSQRTDTTTAQQRVLDEGKQNLQDWATLAGTDPANRAVYVANFNKQLALIDQAYRQMKLDTSRDIAKYETALPNLAEFESFYSVNGERDFLVADMQVNLAKPIDPELIYRMQELSQRRS